MLLVVGGACRSGAETGAEGSLLVPEAEAADSRLRAALEHECIAAGGEQEMTVSVDSDVGVRYTSTYADGESGREPPHGGGYGGFGVGFSSDGAMTDTWEVSEDAPPGLVVVYVSVLLPGDSSLGGPDEALTRVMVSFGLVGPDEECPGEGEPWPESPSTAVTDTGDEHPDVQTGLAHECVQAGGEQVLTVRGAGVSVSYNSVYANGENGRPRPSGGGYGGAGLGLAVDGVVEQPWTVEQAAPDGHVAVLVHAPLAGENADEGVSLRLSYLLVGPEQECP